MRIDGFQFPQRTSLSHMRMVEAKSKVRKEIRIRSLIRAASPSQLEHTLDRLRGAVERFDRGEATLSLQPGRYFQGRRRRFDIHPGARSLAAGVDLLVWTADRFERSETLHAVDGDTHEGVCRFALFNRGNWPAPLRIELEAASRIEQVTTHTGNEVFELNTPVNAGQRLTIDTEQRTAELDGVNVFEVCNQNFTSIAPGGNELIIELGDVTAKAACRVEFRDRWA